MFPACGVASTGSVLQVVLAPLVNIKTQHKKPCFERGEKERSLPAEKQRQAPEHKEWDGPSEKEIACAGGSRPPGSTQQLQTDATGTV